MEFSGASWKSFLGVPNVHLIANAARVLERQPKRATGTPDFSRDAAH
jgi:hypothetical protein